VGPVQRAGPAVVCNWVGKGVAFGMGVGVKNAKRTIGKLAAEACVNVETVRYYERRGLLQQPQRRGGAREYGDEALWRLRYIKLGQQWGLELHEMKTLLLGAEQSANFCASIRNAAARRIEAIDRKIGELLAQKEQLSTFIRDCAAKPDADRCPIYQRIAAARATFRG
jgi:MerR family mercuric resistance operon transcriptional regulator